MRFVIKNYIKTSHTEDLYATFTDIVKDVSEAKEKYADILKNEKQILAKEKKQRLESDIANYKKWLEESEEELEKLKAEEGEK